MKTASRSRFLTFLPMAILGGLLTMLVATMVMPALSFSPELAALALSGVIIYSFGALALIGRRRSRMAGSRAARLVLADAIITRPARPSASPVRHSRREPDRLAA